MGAQLVPRGPLYLRSKTPSLLTRARLPAPAASDGSGVVHRAGGPHPAPAAAGRGHAVVAAASAGAARFAASVGDQGGLNPLHLGGVRGAVVSGTPVTDHPIRGSLSSTSPSSSPSSRNRALCHRPCREVSWIPRPAAKPCAPSCSNVPSTAPPRARPPPPRNSSCTASSPRTHRSGAKCPIVTLCPAPAVPYPTVTTTSGTCGCRSWIAAQAASTAAQVAAPPVRVGGDG
jgi:hypothetical protein